MKNKHKEVDSDLQNAAHLITQATLGITQVTEEMYQRVLYPPFLPRTFIQKMIEKVAKFVFWSIRKTTHASNSGAQALFGSLPAALSNINNREKREAFRSIANGVVGDYLEKEGSSLAIQMSIRQEGQSLGLGQKQAPNLRGTPKGKILLLIHGSCMNDFQWTRNGHNHGELLAAETNQSLLYLHYNSGRHISKNGRQLSQLLEELVAAWPVPVEEINLVCHSMGGLLARSATHYAKKSGKKWLSALNKVAFLGTPHHGAPLERYGNYIDTLLEAVPYARPFAKIGKIRSAGVTDLRYGNLLDSDWNKGDRFDLTGDIRTAVPLHQKDRCYAVVGLIGEEGKKVSEKVLGDGLVYLESGLGKHDHPEKHLNFESQNTWVAHSHNHFDLLDSSAVYEKLRTWLS